MDGPVFADGIHPTWSLPPHLARNYVGPKPTFRPTASAGETSSKSSDTLLSDSQEYPPGVRFPVATEGRNAIQSLYALPPAGLRFDRLDKHHAIHVRNIDGLYYPKALVRHVLRPEPGKVKRVLDLAATSSYLSGGGGGNWAIDMALEFPHVEVICIDKRPHPSKQVPRNCQFQMLDFLEEMPDFHGQFDLVHARTIGYGVGMLEYPNLIEEIGRCLIPGGLALFCDGDFQLLDHDFEPQEMALDDEQNDPPAYSWLARLFFEAYNTFKTAGSAMDAGMMLPRWLRDCEAFEDVEGAKVYTPIGPWKSSPDPQEAAKWLFTGTLMRENLIEFAHALVPVLLKESPEQYTREQIMEWVNNAEDELETLSVRLHVRYHYAWAVKRHDYVDPPWHEPNEPSELGHPRYIYIDPDEDEEEDEEDEEPEDDALHPGEEKDEQAVARSPKRFRSASSSPVRRYVTLGANELPESDLDDGKGTSSDEDSDCAEDRRRHSPRRRLSPPDLCVEYGSPAIPLSTPGSSIAPSTPALSSDVHEHWYVNPYPHLKFVPTADWRPDPEAIDRARLDELHAGWGGGGDDGRSRKRKVTPLARPDGRALFAPPQPSEMGVRLGQ